MAISKLRIPELEEPVTRGRVTVDRGLEDQPVSPGDLSQYLEYWWRSQANALHAFSQGALFGLVVAGQILCNVLTVLSLVAT